MRKLIGSFARNTVFANIVLTLILFVGAAALVFMIRETFPEMSFDVISPWAASSSFSELCRPSDWSDFAAQRDMNVAEQYCSMHPLCPQPHNRPPGTIIMWPSSAPISWAP